MNAFTKAVVVSQALLFVALPVPDVSISQANSSLPGDIAEKDCVVNVFDTQIIAFRWGAPSSHPAYEANYDIEGSPAPDGDIDILDLQAVWGRFGSTCADPAPLAPPPASQSITVSVSPTSVPVTAGQQVAVTVSASQMTDIGAYEFRLGYDNEIVDCTLSGCGYSMGLGSGHPTCFTVMSQYLRRAVGCVTLRSAINGDSITGSGTLATFTFTAQKTGTATFSVEGARFGDRWGQRVASSGTVVTLPPPVMLVHGWNSDCSGMAAIEQLLVSEGNDFVEVECFDPPNDGYASGYNIRQGGWDSAVDLGKAVASFRSSYGMEPGDKIDIVAHSWGGLVSRAYIEGLQGDNNVARLAMLGTPNRGLKQADICYRISRHWLSGSFLGGEHRSCRDMTEGSAFIKELNALHNLSPPSTTYKVYAGTGGGIFAPLASGTKNDCLVDVASARGKAFSTKEVNAIHTEGMPLCPYGAPALNGSGSPAFPFLLRFLTRDSGNPAGSSTAGTPPEPVELPAYALDKEDIVSQGGTDSFQVDIDATADVVIFTLLWEGAGVLPELTLAVDRPGGGAVAASDPDVTHMANLASDDFSSEAYVVDMPASGTWDAHVTGASVGEDGQPYVLLVRVESVASLTLDTDSASYLPGQSALIEAVFSEDAAAVLGATVSGIATFPDDSVSGLTFVDDGTGNDTTLNDGIYTATLGELQCGEHVVNVQGLGTGTGGALQRADVVIVSAAVEGDQVGDPCNPDEDADGCVDGAETGPEPRRGGLRDPTNPWDFYDVAGAGGGPPDRVIDLFNDILGVIYHWSPGGGPPYDSNFDRGPSTGPYPWNMTAPDSVIDLFNDILGVIGQWMHDCR